jgi:hypothetical protein
VPAEFEPSDEAVFDFRCDVAAGLHEPIPEMVTEAASLGEFRNVVGDEPGLMAMSEPVKCQAWPNRSGAFVCVAVDSWPENPAIKSAAPKRVTQWAREYEIAGGGGEVHLQQAGEEAGQGGAGGGGCLGRPEPELTGGFVQSTGIRVDGDGAMAKVDVVALQTGKLAPPTSGPRRGDDQ